VANTGAFQRLIDEGGFLRRLPPGITPEEGLKRIPLERLPPCYTVVLIDGSKSPSKTASMAYGGGRDGRIASPLRHPKSVARTFRNNRQTQGVGHRPTLQLPPPLYSQQTKKTRKMRKTRK
jgi:hypothetical protein